MSKIIWFFGNCYAMDGVIRDETLIGWEKSASC